MFGKPTASWAGATRVPSATRGTRLAGGLDRDRLQAAMGPGAARNALDCAFWDLAAKQSGRPVHEIAGLPPLKPLDTLLLASTELGARYANSIDDEYSLSE